MITRPLLEITIPTFNRPDQLRENLANLCRQAADFDDGSVAVRVLDDTSTNPAVGEYLAEQSAMWPFLTVETNPENLGLERNVTKAIMTTTGEFGLVPGDDDALIQGGLREMLRQLASVPDDVGLVVFDKHRVDLSGQNYIPEIRGSKPESAAPGKVYSYESPTTYCSEMGFLSGLGLTSTVAFRSEPCRSVDATKYLELTVFPQVGIWLEAFANSPLLFCSQPLVVQRTMPQEAKLAEAKSRREEKHMDANTKDTHYLSLPYAAKLQRLIDAHALTVRDIKHFPERLLTHDKLLLDWIAGLARIAIEQGLTFRKDVAEDAARFFDALDTHLAAEIRLSSELA